MMESLSHGLANAVFPDVYKACIDCFDMIQLGRNFGKDYEKCSLRLDVSKARFRRWGESVGFVDGHFLQDGYDVSDEDRKTATRLLSSIHEIFEDMERKSKRYESKTRLGVNLDAGDTDEDMTRGIQHLRISNRDNAAGRQSQTRLRSKVVWAIYEKKDFGRMIEDIAELVGALIDLFPAAIPMQQELVANDVASIRHLQDLQILSEVPRREDPLLHDAVKEGMETRGSIFNNLRAEGSSQLHAGDDVAYGCEGRSHVYNGGSSTENAHAHFGNIYRGKDDYRSSMP